MTETLLVIDDNEAVGTALDVLFSMEGIRVVTATGPEEGLAVLDSQPVDLVIQDMNFTADTTSGEEGRKLFRAIRERDPDLPVILCGLLHDQNPNVEYRFRVDCLAVTQWLKMFPNDVPSSYRNLHGQFEYRQVLVRYLLLRCRNSLPFVHLKTNCVQNIEKWYPEYQSSHYH